MDDEEQEELFDIIEIDRMTGNDRMLWMHVGVTRKAANQATAWLEKNITNRYGYEIVTTWLHAGGLQVELTAGDVFVYPEGTVRFKSSSSRDQSVPAKLWPNNQWVDAITDQPFSKIAQESMWAAYDAWEANRREAR